MNVGKRKFFFISADVNVSIFVNALQSGSIRQRRIIYVYFTVSLVDNINVNDFIGKRLRNVNYFTHAQFQAFTYPFIVYMPTGVNDRRTVADCFNDLTE